MRRFLILLIMLGAAGASADPGETGFEVLSLGGGPRAAALGDGGVARLSGGVDEVFVNPASLSRAGRPEGWSSYAALPNEVSLTELGLGVPTRFGAFAAHVQQLDHGAISAYDSTTAPIGTVRASDTVFLLSWARSVNRFASLGANVKVVNERLASVKGRAEAFDLGFGGAVPGVRGLSYGAVVRNLGVKASVGGSSVSVPREEAVGLTHRSMGDALVLSADVSRRTGQSSPKFMAGGEYWLKDTIALRAGYGSFKGPGPGAAFGLGFKLSPRSRLDYSYSPQGVLGDVHRFSISFGFGGGRVAGYYEDGVRQMREENYPDAVILFDKVLTLDPEHPSAARLLKESGERLRDRAVRQEDGPASLPKKP